MLYEHHVLAMIVWVGAQITFGILGYRQGRRDERLALLERQSVERMVRGPSAMPEVADTERAPRGEGYCAVHEEWYVGTHCPDCTLPSVSKRAWGHRVRR